jgi:3-hydroxybutyryl-CoA dehydrogenase
VVPGGRSSSSPILGFVDAATIAVIGAGAVGSAYARAALLGGLRVILEDISQTALECGITEVRRRLDDAVVEGKIEAAARDAALGRLAIARTVEDAIRDADLIIETVPEEMEMHIELFTVLDKFARPNAIFACGTAMLSINEMAEVTFCADRCIGMRLRGDAVLELVRASETSEQTIATCRAISQRMGKQVYVVGESESSAPASVGVQV